MERPNIFHYLDYRPFLTDMIAFKRTQKSYSARTFARKSGLGSPSYMKMVIDGIRNIGADTAARIAAGLELKKNETEYFQALVTFTQAQTQALKESAYEDILGLREQALGESLDSSLYQYFSNPYFSAVFEAADFVNLNRASDTMARELGITVAELEKSFEIMSQLGLIEKKDRGWKRAKGTLETRPETQSLMVRKYHRENLRIAADKLDSVRDVERDFQGVTIALADDEFNELKEKLFKFLSKISRTSSRKKPRVVYQINTQIYPVLHLDEEKS